MSYTAIGAIHHAIGWIALEIELLHSCHAADAGAGSVALPGHLAAAQRFRNPSLDTARKSVIMRGPERGSEVFRNQMFCDRFHPEGRDNLFLVCAPERCRSEHLYVLRHGLKGIGTRRTIQVVAHFSVDLLLLRL